MRSPRLLSAAEQEFSLLEVVLLKLVQRVWLLELVGAAMVLPPVLLLGWVEQEWVPLLPLVLEEPVLEEPVVEA